MSIEAIVDALPQEHRIHLDSGAPKPARMMAARGLLPLPPRELVLVLCGLTMDPQEELASAATQSLAKLPPTILGPVLQQALPAPAFASLVPRAQQDETLLEHLVVNRATPDEVIADLAGSVSDSIGEMIANDQERCLRSREIVVALRNNGNVPRAVLDRLFDFLVRSGIFFDEIPEFGTAMGRLSPEEMGEVAKDIALPDEVEALVEAELDLDAPPERRQIPVQKLIMSLSVAQKVALATKGNKEARTILVRDTNRVVATSAIKNPRITEPEVAAAAQSRTVHEDVIRYICTNKEMMRSYSVKSALVQNPKTPLQVSMRLLPLLRGPDIRNIANSKGIPQALANQAKRLAKSGKGR